jgi:hypothetical protein
MIFLFCYYNDTNRQNIMYKYKKFPPIEQFFTTIYALPNTYIEKKRGARKDSPPYQISIEIILGADYIKPPMPLPKLKGIFWQTTTT